MQAYHHLDKADTFDADLNLITSRKPDDLTAFNAALLDAMA